MKTNFKTMSALQGFVSAVSIILVIIGLAVLAGWVFNIQFLRSVLPRAANMQFNTALGILSAGTSLWHLRDEEERSRQKLIGQALALLIVLLGSLSLSQYLFGWNLGIDELFIKDSATSPSPFPGRMSPISAVCFTLSGLSLLWIGTKPSQYLALSVLILSLLAVIGYLFDYGALYRLPGYISMALHSGVSFLILSLGILAARPSLGFMKLLVSGVAAGRTALFLIPTTILLIILLGYAVELGGRLRILASGNESAIVVVLLILVYTPLIYFYLNRIHQAEMEIVRLSRLYATLSQVGQTIVRVKSQQELYESICTLAVESGQFRLAWIGLFDSGTGQVTPVAEHGYGEPRLPFAKIDANESPFDRGLTALAIRSDSPQFSHNIQADPRMAHWHESSALGGYHSAAALPIRQKGQVIGLLSLYAADIGFFAVKEERNLLEELASNISFALDALQVEAERARAEERFRLVVESMPNSIVMVDGDGKIRLVNGQTEMLFGYSRAELTGQSVDILVPDLYREVHTSHRALFLGHPSARPMGMGRELFGLRKDGSEFPIEIGLNPIETEQGSMVVASIVDITERKRAEEARREIEKHYRLLFNEIRYGFALHEIICDGSGKPVDYRFLEINPAFEKLTGLRASELVGRTVLEALPNTEPSWIETYGRVAITGEPVEFSSYAREFDRYYEVSAYRPRPGQFAVIFMDVTERQMTRIKLEESENRYRSLFDNMPTGYAHCQMLFENRQPHDFIYLSANPAFETLTGLKDVTGKRVSAVIPGIRESNPELFEIYGRVALSGKPERFETRIDSLGIWLSISVYCPNEGDFAAIFENITERKRAEAEISNLAKFPTENPNPILRVETDGKINYANAASRELLDAWHCSVHDHLPGELRELAAAVADNHMIKSVDVFSTDRVYALQFVPIPEGGYINIYGRDITERKRAEQALKQSEEQYRALIEQAGDGIFISDSTGRYIDVNSAGITMLGYSREDLLQKNLSDLIPAEDQGKNPPRLDDLRAGKTIIAERRLIRKDGSLLPVEISGKMLSDGRLQGIVRDITERKRAERQILQIQRLYATLSQVNEIIVRTTDGDQLYQSICDVAVQFGGLALAWVGLLDEDTGEVRPVKANGLDISRWPFPNANIHQSDSKDGLIATALCTSRVVTSEDIQADRRLHSISSQVGTYGYHSMAAVPFQLLGRTIGILSLISNEIGFFNAEEEVRLLEEMGSDISFALDTLAIRAEKLQAEQLSRESEQKFSILFMKAPYVVQLSRLPDGAIVDVNEEFENVLGYSRQEAVGRTSLELNLYPDPGVRSRSKADFEARGSARNVETVLRTKSGNLLTVLVSTDLLDVAGIKYVLVTAQDITERKRAEQELQQSNARFTRMVESNMVGIAIADASGRIMLANDYYLQLLNVTRQDFLEEKVDWRKFTPPEWLPADEKALHELNEHGVCEPYEKEYVRADGSRVAVYIADAMLPGPDEQIIALILDITERKRAEEKLARQNQRLKVLREIDTAILAADSVESIVDAALSHILKLIECRRTGLAVFDWEKKEAVMFEVKMDQETFLPKGTRVPLAPFQDIIQTLSKNQPVLVNDTNTVIDPPPVIRRIIGEGIRSHYVIPLFSQGNLVGTISMSADITNFFDEEKINLGQEVANQVAIALTQSSLLDALRELNVELEQRVRERTADLEAANKELEAFSYSVSHDLRAPVRHISGFIELLNRRAPDLDAKNRHYLATIAQSAQQMGTLIDDLLAFSRLGRAEMKKTKVDLEALVCQTIPELQVDTADRDIVWKIGSLPQVYGDHVLLKSVLTNLISNALKFTKTRPQAVIEIGTKLSLEGEIVCYVHDNGVGFDMQYAEKLFGLFQRLHRPEEFEGTGVGLANVRRIIHRHGGRTWAEGELDRGATFYFSLPSQSGGQP